MSDELPPILPCRACRAKGQVLRPDKLFTMCTSCRGFGYCSTTLDLVRAEYRRLRSIVCKARGFSPQDVDKLVEKRVARTQFVTGRKYQEAWFTSLFFIAKEFGLEEEWFQALPAKTTDRDKNILPNVR